ncbi:putative uncharacterized protein DDB_G0282133 [Saccostrea cucullata]|uniref:putative uncharacterized protein DDB_G0282133 n=1 Tax=Saccostrea cuccullata TaxID=36930 RepID=UPI002ED2CADA
MSTGNNDVELKEGLGQEHNKESEKSPRPSSQMKTTNNALDVRAANDIRNNQSGRNNENVVGATESSNNNPVSDGATDNPNASENQSERDIENAADTTEKKRNSPNDDTTYKPVEMNTPNVPENQSERYTENAADTTKKKRDSPNDDTTHKTDEMNTPNVPENQSERYTENAADTTIKKRNSPNDDATHKPVEMITPNVPDDQSKRDTENATGTAEKNRDSPNDDAKHKHNDTSIQSNYSGKDIQNNEDTSESSTDDKGTTTICESKCHGDGSPTNVPDNAKISPGEMDEINDSKDTAGKSNSDTEPIENTEVSKNSDDFSNQEYGSRVPQTPEGNIKSKSSWNDKMKTQAVTVVLVMYGILILLLLYMVMNSRVPSSPIPIPPTPEKVLKKISAISFELDALKLENLKLSERVKNQETDIQRIEGKINKLNETVEGLKQIVEYLREKLPFLDGKLKWMEQEQTEHGNYILLFLFVFLLIFLGVMVLIMRRRETQPTSISTGRIQSSVQFQSKVGGRTNTSVLDQIHPNGLKKTIGIVSFNNKTHKIHKEMLQRALDTMDINTEIDAVLVDREDKILTIKPSCLVFIFVDRNDRNIILEDSESEIGNLRRITTQSFMKMGSTVVVVYVNDRKSRNLDGRDLYNPFLQSVKRHPVLRELQEKGRVFSVMDNFNQNQNEHIKQLLKNSGL